MDGELRVKDTLVSEYGLERISNLAGIPVYFLPKLSPSTATRVLRECVGRQDKQIVALRDPEIDQVVSFAWENHIPVRTDRMVEALAPLGLSPIPSKEQVGISESATFISDPTAFEVVGGDNIHFGVALHNSLDGSTDVGATLSFYRPTCTNGAYLNEASWKMSRRELNKVGVSAMMIRFAEKAVGMLEVADGWKERIRGLAGIPIEDVDAKIEQMVMQLGLPQHVLSPVIEAYMKEPVPTMWGVLNAFTAAANTTPRYAGQLWRAAGVMVEAGDTCRVCGTCPSRYHCSARRN
jgi:hypothetical protein